MCRQKSCRLIIIIFVLGYCLSRTVPLSASGLTNDPAHTLRCTVQNKGTPQSKKVVPPPRSVRPGNFAPAHFPSLRRLPHNEHFSTGSNRRSTAPKPGHQNQQKNVRRNHCKRPLRAADVRRDPLPAAETSAPGHGDPNTRA